MTDPEEESGELLESQLRHIQLMQAAVEATLKDGDANPALARESANLARAAIRLDERLSKRRHEAVVRFRKLTTKETLEGVLGWVSELPKELRVEAKKRVAAMGVK